MRLFGLFLFILLAMFAPKNFAHELTQADYRKANEELTKYALKNWNTILKIVEDSFDENDHDSIVPSEVYDKKSLNCMGAHGSEISLQGVCSFYGSVSEGEGHYFYVFGTWKGSEKFRIHRLSSTLLNEF